MKKMLTALALTGYVLACPLTMAAEQTVSLGYAHARIPDVGSLKGINLQYRYEWNSPLSIVGSFSYMKDNDNEEYHDDWGDSYKTSINAKYYSLLVGPAYRVSEYVSVYGLFGAAYTKMNGSYEWRNSIGADTADGHLNINDSASSTSFAYAAGVIISPINNLSVSLGYESSHVDFFGGNKSIEGYNISIGYRF